MPLPHLRSLLRRIRRGLATVALAPVALTPVAVVLCWGAAAHADAARVLDLLQTDRLFTILQGEGVSYGNDLAQDMLGQPADASWGAIVRAIHDPAKLLPEYRERFAASLDPAQSEAIETWLSSDLGRRSVDLELTAREAMLTPEVEDKAIEAAARASDAHDPALAAVRRVIAAGDTIDTGVASAMNANLAFYRAMSEAGAFPQKLSDEVMIADVAAEEEAFRQDITSWTEGWLLFAYRPLSARDMKDLAVFAASPAGRALSRAQTVAFDAIYAETSAELGRALARRVRASDL